MKKVAERTILLPVLLLCFGTRESLGTDVVQLPPAAPCFDRPDIVPSESVVAEALVRERQVDNEALPTATSEVDALLDTTISPALSANINGPAEETTTTTTTETTTTSTTTTAAETTTTTAASLGIGGSFNNLISGGASGGSGSGGILSLFGATQRTTPQKKGPTGNFDQYLDNILRNLATSLRQSGFDPLALGNMLQCRNCTLEGLSLIRRNGPSNLKYANRTLTVDAHLQLPALYISCFPCVQVVLMVPFTGMLEVALWDLQIYGEVTQRTERNAHPSLTKYRVLREGDLDVTLNGYGLLGPVTEMGFKILQQRQVSEIIREFVYERIPNFVHEKLQGFSFPIGK